ncbi:hypothetical protein [Thalassomonas actiniarum]|uniref:Uncharacterized protein n=1 Tax=Thalassomonas actiniarum TaxID=485447 RepID=A0AAE9YP88_9GAMM|nr:hypothetical protein [Thalassomonas actiniarum]WDD98251.1 hypothetical protein SG35_023710 [Thalassomonas actiniarum]
MYSINDLNFINEELQPLKILADREHKAIYGLSGKLYTPHIDTYTEACIKKAGILLDLKNSGMIAFTEVEIISAKLMVLHRKAKNREVVEYDGWCYECRYLPLKLSKSGKIVRKWAKYWLRKLVDGGTDNQWEAQVKEIWPEYFVLRNFDN